MIWSILGVILADKSMNPSSKRMSSQGESKQPCEDSKPKGMTQRLKRLSTRKLAITLSLLLVASGSAIVTHYDLPVDAVGGYEKKEKEPPKEDPPPPPDPPTIYGWALEGTGRVVYVIDISGSMNVTTDYSIESGGIVFHSPTRIEKAKTEVKKSIARLEDGYEVNIFVYNCSVTAFSKDCVTLGPDTRPRINAWISSLRARGGTATGWGVVEALEDKDTDYVVVLTDGEPHCRTPPRTDNVEYHLHCVRQANTQNAIIDTFCIDGSLDFPKKLATENSGKSFEVK
jgi:hypothetical protein